MPIPASVIRSFAPKAVDGTISGDTATAAAVADPERINRRREIAGVRFLKIMAGEESDTAEWAGTGATVKPVRIPDVSRLSRPAGLTPREGIAILVCMNGSRVDPGALRLSEMEERKNAAVRSDEGA